MYTIAQDLEEIINEYLPLLYNIPEINFSFKPSPKVWSKKETIGHLIDSAQNNIRRFVVGQYEKGAEINYDREKWVSFNDYATHDSEDVINLWYLLNKNICKIIRKCPEASLLKEVKTDELHTIDWLAKDYINHLLHHLHAVLEMETVDYQH